MVNRFKVKFTNPQTVKEWQSDNARTLYVLDVRTRDEFERAHIAGSRHAAGGQLVQASDEYVGVRNARVVLIDPERVRAVMTASWLNQMSWNDAYVLDGVSGFSMKSGSRPRPEVKPWKKVVKEAAGSVLDPST